DPVAVAVLIAAAVVATVVGGAVVVIAVSGGAGCRGSYCCRPNRRAAIRIIPSAIGSATIGPPAIGRATIGAATLGHATARNANRTASGTCRVKPSAANPSAATTTRERIIGNQGRADEHDRCKSRKSITKHRTSSSDLDAVRSSPS